VQVECGYQLTNKLEGMFNDIRLSAETMENFKKYLAQKKVPSLCLSLSVSLSLLVPHTPPSVCPPAPGSHPVRELVWDAGPIRRADLSSSLSLPLSLPPSFNLAWLTRRQLELHGVEISVKVLTTGYWPSQATAACTFPAEIQECCMVR
jgi:hypothetical protein